VDENSGAGQINNAASLSPGQAVEPLQLNLLVYFSKVSFGVLSREQVGSLLVSLTILSTFSPIKIYPVFFVLTSFALLLTQK
jgi:hypothetical protein